MSVASTSDGALESPGSARVPSTLTPNPVRRIFVPFVTGVGNRAQRRLDLVPTSLVLQRSPDRLCDERASPSRAGPAVELGYQMVVQRYVHAHASTVAHKSTVYGPAKAPGHGSAPVSTSWCSSSSLYACRPRAR